MFQRQGPSAYKADLSATRKVCEVLGNPEKGLKFIHVAGTNGKGTVCHMVASALQASGCRVGLFTSPHLIDFRERIRVNGACISESSVVEFVRKWEDVGDAWGTPSFFELTFGMALDHFRSSGCEIVVLETGMGGRLDSTNVIPPPEVACVTNVGLDHQQFLGNDVRTIAREKAGILKDGVPVVLGPMRPEAQSEVLSAALRHSCEVHVARDHEKDMASWSNHLVSPVDRANGSTAFAICHVLNQQGWSLSNNRIQEGILHHRRHTGQRGRWQCIELPGKALIVLDGAHNLDGVSATHQALSGLLEQRGGRLHVVWGTVRDKNPIEVMMLLPEDAQYWWCAADIPRAMSPIDVSNVRPELKGMALDSPVLALEAALNAANAEDVIWVGGSLFVVGDVLRAAPAVWPEWPS